MFRHLERFGENRPMPQARQGLDPFKICKSRVNQIIFALKASRKLRADVDGGGAGSVRNFVSRRRLRREQFEEGAGRQLINWPPSSKMCQPIPGPGVRAGSETTSEFYFLFFWNRNLTLQTTTNWDIFLAHKLASAAQLQDVLSQPIPGVRAAGASS